MGADGAGAGVEAAGDFFVGETFGDGVQDVFLFPVPGSREGIRNPREFILLRLQSKEFVTGGNGNTHGDLIRVGHGGFRHSFCPVSWLRAPTPLHFTDRPHTATAAAFSKSSIGQSGFV